MRYLLYFSLETVSFKILPNGIKNIFYTFAIGITREKLQIHAIKEIKDDPDNCAIQSKNCKNTNFGKLCQIEFWVNFKWILR